MLSRFHHERHPGGIANAYNATREGFRDYCEKANREFVEEERAARFKNVSLLEIMPDVPCRAEFFRYVQWHNLAFQTCQATQLDTLVVYFDSYDSRLLETTSELLEFLGLTRLGPSPDFAEMKVYAYRDYFTLEERKEVGQMLNRIASPTALRHLLRYI